MRQGGGEKDSQPRNVQPDGPGEVTTMYRLSKYWNRIAYRVIRLGHWMIWDQTGGNAEILTKQEFGSQYSEDIMTTL